MTATAPVHAQEPVPAPVTDQAMVTDQTMVSATPTVLAMGQVIAKATAAAMAQAQATVPAAASAMAQVPDSAMAQAQEQATATAPETETETADVIAHYLQDRHRPNKERTDCWRILWARLSMSEAEREAIAREGMAAKDRIAAHMRGRERMVRVAPAQWQRVAAGLAHAVEGAQPLLARRVVSIRRVRV